jgi:tetratricopeptide (TPR) repeat protein
MKIQRALYNVGEVYRNNLNDYPLALDAYKELIERYPEGEYKVAAYYAIYRVYIDQKETAQADVYKNMIIRNYPDSKYAKVLLDPNYFKQFEEEEKKNRNDYQFTIDLYKQGKYQEVIRRCEMAIQKHKNTEYYSKYRYLKAISIGEVYGITSMKPELESIIADFETDPVVLSSEKLLASIRENELKNIKDIQIADNTDTTEIKTEIREITQKSLADIEKIYSYQPEREHVFVVVISNKADINQLKFNIINFNLDYDIEKTFDVESSEFNEFTAIVTVKNFENTEEGLAYHKKFEAEKQKLFTDVKSEDYQYFIISDKNLTSLLNEKMISDYLLFYRKYYRE